MGEGRGWGLGQKCCHCDDHSTTINIIKIEGLFLFFLQKEKVQQGTVLAEDTVQMDSAEDRLARGGGGPQQHREQRDTCIWGTNSDGQSKATLRVKVKSGG